MFIKQKQVTFKSPAFAFFGWKMGLATMHSASLNAHPSCSPQGRFQTFEQELHNSPSYFFLYPPLQAGLEVGIEKNKKMSYDILLFKSLGGRWDSNPRP